MKSKQYFLIILFICSVSLASGCIFNHDDPDDGIQEARYDLSKIEALAAENGVTVSEVVSLPWSRHFDSIKTEEYHSFVQIAKKENYTILVLKHTYRGTEEEGVIRVKKEYMIPASNPIILEQSYPSPDYRRYTGTLNKNDSEVIYKKHQ